MKRNALIRLRQALFGQEGAWQIHEPALAALMTFCYGPQAKGTRERTPPRAVIAERLGMHAADGPTTQMVGQVAVLPIVGVMQQKASWVTRYMGWTATEILERDFKAAIADSQVKAIVLYCDSPGGTALGNEEVHRTIYQARGKKPIVAFVRGLAASACYYVASAAEKVVASPSSTVGSIGTIWVHAEYSKMFAAAGISVSVLRHGENKGIGNQYEPLKPEARAKLQAWIDGYGNQFEAAVAKGRGISAADVRAKFGQGDAFLAGEAKQRGMVDAVSSWEQVLASLSAGSSAPLPQPGQIHAEPRSRGEALSGVAASDFHLALRASAPPRETLALDLSASADSPAGILAGVSLSTPAAAGNSTMNKKIKAVLFARGLIDSMEADDALCKSLLAAWFGACGKAVPASEDEILKGLHAIAAIPIADGGAGAGATGTGAAANVQAAHDREVAEAKAEGAKNEAARQKSIRASGELLKLSAEQIEAAIVGGKPHAEVVAAWHTELAGKEKPIGQAHVKVGQEGIERYTADAALAIQLHYGLEVPGAQVTPEVSQLSQAPLLVHAERCLQAAGVRFDPYDREAVAQAALAMDGYEHTTIRAEGVPFNRPGSFPNLLSNLANKVLDQGVELAETTYPDYTGVWPGDLPDFKPAPVVAKGMVGEFDEVLDAEEFKEQKLDEECLSYMQLARFGNSVGLTPVLLANDDLSAFMENLLGLSEGWELTVNRGCLRLVTGNVTLLDGVALYDDATHGNLITAGGGAPSVTTWDDMQQKMAAQTTIGDKGYARARLNVVLVPPNHDVAASQTFLPLGGTVVVETKQAATDSNLNVFRGKVRVSVEPELQASSNDIWYGFADPTRFRNAAIIRAYFRGFPRRGKRERWYDPKTKCWWVSLEGRAGFAAKQYRTTVRNPGA